MCLACVGEPVAAGLAGRVTSSFVFVVGGDEADGGVQAALWGSARRPGR